MAEESICAELLPKGMRSCLRKGRHGEFEVGLDADDGAKWRWKTVDAKTWPKARRLATGALVELLRESSTRLVERANALVKQATERDQVARNVAREWAVDWYAIAVQEQKGGDGGE